MATVYTDCDIRVMCMSCNALMRSVKRAIRKRIAWMQREMLRGVYRSLEKQAL
jgi:hypothetical protein